MSHTLSRINICILDFNILTFIRLLLFAFKHRKSEKIVYYGYNFGTGIDYGVDYRRPPKIPFRKILEKYYTFEILPLADDIEGFPEIETIARRLVCFVPLDKLDDIRKSPYTRVIGRFLGKEEATAYFAKNLGHKTLYSRGGVLSLAIWATMISRKVLPGRNVLMVPFTWPNGWAAGMARHLPGTDFENIDTPGAIKYLANIVSLAAYWGYLAVWIISSVKNQKICFSRNNDKKQFKYFQEFSDPQRLNNGVYDNDNLVDGQKITKSDVLFYVTPVQEHCYLKRIEGGCSKAHVYEVMKQKDYTCVFLSDLPIPSKAVGLVIGAMICLALRGLNPFTSCNAFNFLSIRFLKEYLSLSPLYHHYHAGAHIFLVMLEGTGGPRYYSALTTGLCHRNGIQSLSYQNRPYYGFFIEFSFDCFDRLLLWGPSSHEYMRPFHTFVKHIDYVGCVHTAGAAIDATSTAEGAQDRPIGHTVLTVFTSDLCQDTCMTPGYTRRMLKAVAELADRRKDVTIWIKSKRPERHVDIFKTVFGLERAACYSEGRMRFLVNRIYDNEGVISRSDVVVAIGYTTPGFHALLLEKPTIFYDEIQHAFPYLYSADNLTAASGRQLVTLLEKAVNERETFSRGQGAIRCLIDRYRDEKALDRIRDILNN